MKGNATEIVNGVGVLSIIDYGWGDGGKGKVVDTFSEWADVFARGGGGNNAGHTLVLDGQSHIFHLLPCGILRDGEGKTNLMGKGMVIDLEVLVGEIDVLENQGMTYDNLRISEDATVILPHHKFLDGAQSGMGKGKIGTTGRGIGPAYEDFIGRRAVRVGDLNNRELFARNLKKLAEGHYAHIPFDVDGILERELGFFGKIKDLVCDTDILLRGKLNQGRNILLEGAQGLLLSIDYGTYPYVTSSDPSKHGLAKGVGLLSEEIDLNLGVVKFPFMTRVGNGPFPTEFGGKVSEDYCAAGNGNQYGREMEQREYKEVREMLNGNDPFLRGVALRILADEYGATTGRPRRVGRADLLALEYAARINGPDVVLTKMDCATGMEKIELGMGYQRAGVEGIIEEVNQGREITYDLEGVYHSFPGWSENLRECDHYGKFPQTARDLVDFAESFGVRVRMISTGREATQYVLLD